MSRLRLLAAAGLALAAVLLADCPLTREQGDRADIPEETPEVNTELFEPQTEPGTFLFVTNDPALWGPYGSTLWALTGTGQQPFTARELELAKISGNESAGFGAVFCHYTDPERGETMIAVMINTKRQFLVGEITAASFETILPWGESPALLSGYNAANRLRLESDGSSFSLLLNGQPAASFADEEAPFHAGGADGLIVVISPLDRFPATPVHVLFRELAP
jgi:hypothetical protein